MNNGTRPERLNGKYPSREQVLPHLSQDSMKMIRRHTMGSRPVPPLALARYSGCDDLIMINQVDR